MVGGMIAFGILYVIFFFWNVSTNDEDSRIWSAWLLTLSAIIFIALLLSYENNDVPTAKDVYEGKTTLEITYRDSIPVDSVVVFNKNFN